MEEKSPKSLTALKREEKWKMFIQSPRNSGMRAELKKSAAGYCFYFL